MSLVNFLELKDRFEIQQYVKPDHIDKDGYIPFSGSPRKHPCEETRVILIADPFSEVTYFYEFNIEDIDYVEELPSISNIKGESVPMVRIWVKKKSIGLRCAPFIVDTMVRD